MCRAGTVKLFRDSYVQGGYCHRCFPVPISVICLIPHDLRVHPHPLHHLPHPRPTCHSPMLCPRLPRTAHITPHATPVSALLSPPRSHTIHRRVLRPLIPSARPVSDRPPSLPPLSYHPSRPASPPRHVRPFSSRNRIPSPLHTVHHLLEKTLSTHDRMVCLSCLKEIGI